MTHTHTDGDMPGNELDASTQCASVTTMRRMQAIVIDTIVTESRLINIVLPEDIPVGAVVEVIVLAGLKSSLD
ncbi:MAG: hypothetical protein ABIR56_03635 [Polaromonas sp.]